MRSTTDAASSVNRSAFRLLDRFTRHVFARRADECWRWLGPVNPGGYGRITAARGRSVLAHRVSFEHHWGPIPPGRMVCHACDQPWCVNPLHLYLGDAKTNARDCSWRGRAAGTGRGKNKLTYQLAEQMRERAARGESRRDLAAAFGISQRNVYYVLAGRTFRVGRS